MCTFILQTDPESQDYKMEFGAIRNFESVRLAEIQAEQDSKREKEEEENNPMKVIIHFPKKIFLKLQFCRFHFKKLT